MLLKNFLLKQAKTELSPQINHLSTKTGAINQAIKKTITYIDSLTLEFEGETTKDYLTKRQYEALETVLSYLVQEGYSQVRQDHISQKSGISKPIINFIINWLIDLGVCQQIKVRRHNKIAPSIYIFTLHNNYLKIVEYFKTKWDLAIEVTKTFTEQLKKQIFDKEHTSSSNEDEPKNVSTGITYFSPEQSSEKLQDNNEPKTYSDRKEDLNDYLSENQQQAYHYIMSQPLTNLTEKNAYVIALRMPSDIDYLSRSAFYYCVDWFRLSKADISNAAHFMKMYSKRLKELQRNQNEKNKEEIANSFNRKPIKFYNWLEN